jgi:hypothetical protein
MSIAITGHYRWTLYTGWVCISGGTALMTILAVDTPASVWIPLTFLQAIGLGFLIPGMRFAIQGSAPSDPRDASSAVGYFSFFRCLGQTLGVCIGGVIFSNRLKIEVSKQPLIASFAEEASSHAEAMVPTIKAMAAGAEKSQWLEAYMQAIMVVYIAMTFLGLVGLGSSLFIRGYSLNRRVETAQKFDEGLKTPDSEMAKVELKEEIQGSRKPWVPRSP